MTIPEKSNYDTVKLIIRGLVKKKLTEVEYAFNLHLLDQQYGYGAGKGAIGDVSGYGHLANNFQCTRSAVQKAVERLLDMNIIVKEVNVNRFGNRYKFNEDVETWRDRTKPTSVRKVTVVTDSTSRTDSDSRTDSTRVYESVHTEVVEPVHTVVYESVTTNSKGSSINNKSINNQTVNDKREKHTRTNKNSSSYKKVYGFEDLRNVLLTDKEVISLQKRFPNDWTEKINHLSLSKAQHGYKYDSDYMTILKWARDDAKKAAGNNSGQNHGRPPVTVSDDKDGIDAVLADIENKQEVIK